MPPAPLRLSTITDLPRIFSSAAATGRAARSACPPGGNGTIMVMLRDGQLCAQAFCAPVAAESAPMIGAPSAPCINLRRSMDALQVACCRCFRSAIRLVGGTVPAWPSAGNRLNQLDPDDEAEACRGAMATAGDGGDPVAWLDHGGGCTELSER